MPPACKFCRKKFNSGAALNFHIKKVHRNEPAAPVTSKSVKPSAEQRVENDSPQSPAGLCRMIKFGKLKGIPDPLSGPFRLFNDVKPERRRDIPQTQTRSKPVSVETGSSASATASISDTNMKRKEDNEDDDDLTVVGAVPPPQPSTSKRAKQTRGRKRTKLSKDIDTSISSGNSISDAGESFEPNATAKSNDMSTSSIGTPNRSLGSISASATEDDDDIPSQSALSSAGSFTSQPDTGTSQGRASWDPSNLPQQVTVKGKVQPCPICGKNGFKNPRQFTVHLEIHQGLRPFPCPYDGCGSAYETDLQLLEHVSMKHSKENVFQCERCGSSYKTRSHLKRHKCKPQN